MRSLLVVYGGAVAAVLAGLLQGECGRATWRNYYRGIERGTQERGGEVSSG